LSDISQQLDEIMKQTEVKDENDGKKISGTPIIISVHVNICCDRQI